MGWIVTSLIVVQVICAGAIIILVLLQHGKGADMGAAFGSGASGSLFGASGSANFLSRSTAVISGIFFIATIGLAYSATTLRTGRGGLMSTATTPAGTAAAQVPSDSGNAPGSVPPAPAAQGKGAGSADKSSNIPR